MASVIVHNRDVIVASCQPGWILRNPVCSVVTSNRSFRDRYRYEYYFGYLMECTIIQHTIPPGLFSFRPIDAPVAADNTHTYSQYLHLRMISTLFPRSHSVTTAIMARHGSTIYRAMSTKASTLITNEAGVHQTMKISKSWKNKPLFRRQGDVRFKTGMEAATLLVGEAKRRDAHETEFISSLTSTLTCLTPIFERNPRYAFVAKQLMEPERFIQFRVAWIDDVGVVRMNRGWRIQYSSSIGPYEGALHFGSHINTSIIKALGFDAVFSNAVTGFDVGAAVGGSDFNPCDKSDAELQRFCQSFMTELAKYVGPDCDSPWMGMGVGEKEMGYLFGQYKRITNQTSSAGRPFLSGGKKTFYQVLS